MVEEGRVRLGMTAAAGGGGEEIHGFLSVSSFLSGDCEGCGTSKLEGCSCCPFLVSPSGYSKAGDGGQAPPRPHGVNDALLAECFADHAVPLFSFHVTDLSGRSFLISRTTQDFDALHARLASYGEHETVQLPKLPGKKLINANTHTHLKKRVRRYAEYLQSLLTIRWTKDSPMVAIFVTDESKHAGVQIVTIIDEASHQPVTHGAGSGSGGGEWEDCGESEKLRAEVERLRRRVEQLEGGHRAWSNTLQHLLVVTLFHPRREEDHRVRLEKLLKKAVAENPNGKVSEVECRSVRTPKTSEGIPHFSLKQADGQKSTWGLRLDKRHYSCDLMLRGRKLGVAFECQVTLTMGLLGEIEMSILGGDAPSASVHFTSKPLIEVLTSGTKVSWGSLTVPLQEQVSAEIELHALHLLRKKLNPPSAMSFPLGEAQVLFDGEDTVHVAHQRQYTPHVAQALPPRSQSAGKSLRLEATPLGLGGGGEELQVVDESIGLTFVSPGCGLPFSVTDIHRGGVAERTCSVRVGDILEAVGADSVLSARPQVLRALLMWPPECKQASRLVQLTMQRQKQHIHVNLQQYPPSGGGGLKEGGEGSKLVSNVDSVMRVIRREGGPGGVGLPQGWEAGARHETVEIAPLGLILEISALDGRTRIKGFFTGGPAERAELLVEGDEVSEVNGLVIPVGISPACARLTRILESEGIGGGRYIPLCVKRRSAWGMQQTVKVQVWIDPPDGEDWDVVSSSSSDSSGEEGATAQMQERRRPPRAKTRAGAKPVVRGSRRPVVASGGGNVGMGMSGPQMLFKELSGLVTDAFEATMPR